MVHSFCGRSLSRFFCAALLSLCVLCVVGLQRAEAQGPHNLFNHCEVPGENCGNWDYTFAGVEIPGYPGCEIGVYYSIRLCPPSNPALQNPEEQIIIELIIWPDVSDTNDPCYTIQRDYLNPAQYTPFLRRDGFLRNVFFETIEAVVRQRFDIQYPQDSVIALVNPNNGPLVQKYSEQLCGQGKKYYRAIHGACMAPYVHHNYDFAPARTQGEDDGKGAGIMRFPPHHKWNRVRYVPCGVNGPCCVQEFELCRDTLTGQTIATVTAVPTTVVPVCDTLWLEIAPEPGEFQYLCMPYCEDVTPVRVEDGNDPNLARIEPERAGLQGKRREQE